MCLIKRRSRHNTQKRMKREPPYRETEKNDRKKEKHFALRFRRSIYILLMLESVSGIIKSSRYVHTVKLPKKEKNEENVKCSTNTLKSIARTNNKTNKQGIYLRIIFVDSEFRVK